MFQATALGVSTGEQDASRRDAVMGALVMGGSFACGAILPVVPYFIFHGVAALVLSIGIAVVAIFAVGAAIGRLSADNPLRAALEFSAVALGAGGIGYLAGVIISLIAGHQIRRGAEGDALQHPWRRGVKDGTLRRRTASPGRALTDMGTVRDDVVPALQRLPLFAGFDRKELTKLAERFDEQTFLPEHGVLTEGMQGMEFFIILDGNARSSTTAP